MDKRVTKADMDPLPGPTEYPPFPDLQLAREPNGEITFSRAAMERFCRAIGRPLHTLSEDDVGALITAHYLWHLATGGDPVPLVEGLFSQAPPASLEGQP